MVCDLSCHNFTWHLERIYILQASAVVSSCIWALLFMVQGRIMLVMYGVPVHVIVLFLSWQLQCLIFRHTNLHYTLFKKSDHLLRQKTVWLEVYFKIISHLLTDANPSYKVKKCDQRHSSWDGSTLQNSTFVLSFPVVC